MTLSIRQEQLEAVYRTKYGTAPGPKPRVRRNNNYFTPDEYYEALIEQLVTPGCHWIDVGGGRDVFPHFPALSKELAERAGLLVGVDPSENIHDNPYIHDRFQGLIEDYHTSNRFHLVTLRMVAEHIEHPSLALAKIRELLHPSGRLVVYTTDMYTPASLLAWLTPFAAHHVVKKWLWDTEERDTFPVAYKMNTRLQLRHVVSDAGFTEERFWQLDDLCYGSNSLPLTRWELRAWKFCKKLNQRYPESCLLGVYQKPPN